MFNLPNNTPYALVIEASPGYLLMTSRWVSTDEPDGTPGEMGPTSTFECYNTEHEALAAVERFLHHETN